MPKLLLADDSVTIQRVIELTFADEDIDVIAVGDGQRAIERIDADRPDIVLADVGMPERDGYQVSSYVKQHPQMSHVPVILLTGAFERIDEQRARAAGADGVLAKPFEPQAVINQVRELLSRRRAPERQPAAPQPAAAQAFAAPSAPPGDHAWSASPSHAYEPVPDPADVVGSWTQPASDQAAAGDSLDEYFDRLDAAFATMGTGPAGEHLVPAQAAHIPEQPARPVAVQPDRAHTPAPAAAAPAQAALAAKVPMPPLQEMPVPERGPESPRAAAGDIDARERGRLDHQQELPSQLFSAPAPSAAAAPAPPLADAFAALLAAERGQSSPRPAAAPAAAVYQPVQVTDAVVDEVTRRVVERLSDRIIRETVSELVLQVADRLVREEIDRIKAAVR